jgi:hypothetical protein
MYHDRRGGALMNEMDNLYNGQNNPSVRLIRDKIRFGHEPDNPLLISIWLDQEKLFLQELEDIGHRRQYLEQQFRLLLDTIMDELIPSHWRCICLNNIYYPLSSLKKLASDKQSERHIQQLINELSVTSNYVASSLRS